MEQNGVLMENMDFLMITSKQPYMKNGQAMLESGQ